MKKYKISIIGQGFVGLPMSIVLAQSKILNDNKKLTIVGIEKNDSKGLQIVKQINNCTLPFDTKDQKLKKLFIRSVKSKKYYATTNFEDIKNSNTIILSVNVDFRFSESINSFKFLIKNLSNYLNKKTLLIIESTLPPGTCEEIIVPIIKKKVLLKNLRLSYSYERVTPGENYYNSIINSHRCYSGINNSSKKLCRDFLETFINYKKFPLTKFETLRDCESAKIIENSYRALNIAFIDEWVKFSNQIGLNLNHILRSIRLRETHNNIMNPGIGVGGYCLTKDPKFSEISSKIIYKNKIKFPLSISSLRINNNMINTSIDFIKKKIKIYSKKILIIGATYKEDVGDFRESPSISLGKKLLKMGGKVELFDPYIKTEKFKGFKICKNLKKSDFDIYLMTVKHKEFQKVKFNYKKNCKIFDLCNFFDKQNQLNKRIHKLGDQ